MESELSTESATAATEATAGPVLEGAASALTAADVRERRLEGGTQKDSMQQILRNSYHKEGIQILASPPHFFRVQWPGGDEKSLV